MSLDYHLSCHNYFKGQDDSPYLCFCCRHIFLFDVAVIVCKRRGDNYEMKEILDLNQFKITNNPTPDRESKKVSWL